MDVRLPFDPDSFNFEQLPAASAVFLLETDGEPYLNKSADLRRRISRLLQAAPEKRILNLRSAARAISYQRTGSTFESTVLLWRLTKSHFPDTYRKRLRLRYPVLLKLNLDNEYPRCYLTRRLGKGTSLYFGPFPSRLSAERFSAGFLDLFKARRCVEPIHPDPAHPGCIYGEMGMCLRPCQAVVTREVYLEEVGRVGEFLKTQGASLTRVLEAEREQAASELNFEAAAQIHQRLEKAKAALDVQELARKGGLAAELERLHGMVIQLSAQPRAVELFPVYRGFLLPQITFSLAMDVETGKPVSLDARLKEAITGIALKPSGRRMEQLALLARWFYRGTRKGEFVAFDAFENPPYRRIVNAIGRVARDAARDATL